MGWGVLLDAKKKINKMGDSIHVLEMALRISWDSVKDLNSVEKLRPPRDNESAATRFIPVDLDCITAVSAVRIKIPDEKNQEKLKEAIGLTIQVKFNYLNGKCYKNICLESIEKVQWCFPGIGSNRRHDNQREDVQTGS